MYRVKTIGTPAFSVSLPLMSLEKQKQGISDSSVHNLSTSSRSFWSKKKKKAHHRSCIIPNSWDYGFYLLTCLCISKSHPCFSAKPNFSVWFQKALFVCDLGVNGVRERLWTQSNVKSDCLQFHHHECSSSVTLSLEICNSLTLCYPDSTPSGITISVKKIIIHIGLMQRWFL